MSIRERSRPLTLPPIVPPVKLGIDLIPQFPKNNWCWVACAAMVLTYRRVSFGRVCCIPVALGGVAPAECCSFTGGNCDRRASIAEVSALYEIFKIPFCQVGPLSAMEIVAEINAPNEAPVEIAYFDTGFGLEPSGHVVLVFGRDDSGTNFYVLDPLSDKEAAQTFDKLCNPPGGRWVATWKCLLSPTQEVRRAC